MAAGLMMDLAGLRQAFLLGGVLMSASVIIFVLCAEKTGGHNNAAGEKPS
jgi:hypothetical protein